MDFLFFITLIIIMLIFLIYKMQPVMEIAPKEFTQISYKSNAPPKKLNRPAPIINRPAPVINRPAPVINRPAPVSSKDGYYYNPDNDIYELYTEKMPTILSVSDHVLLQ
jgi:hypothetical protein